jgi:hypothetical protein
MAERRTRLGRAIEEAFHELAAGLRDETTLEQYELSPETPAVTAHPASPSAPPLKPQKTDRA